MPMPFPSSRSTQSIWSERLAAMNGNRPERSYPQRISAVVERSGADSGISLIQMPRPCLKKTGAESKESRRIVRFEEAPMKMFSPLLVAAVVVSISCTVPVACATEEKSEDGI